MHIIASVPENWWARLQKYMVDVYYELLADMTEETVDVEGHDPDGDQLAVKQWVNTNQLLSLLFLIIINYYY